MWTTPRTATTVTVLIVLGVLMIIAALWSLAAPGLVWMEWVVAVLGALLFISPWVAAYTDNMGAAWTAWICGGVGIVTGLWSLQPALRSRRRGGGAKIAHA
jgi:hypothetical protein